MPRPRDENKVEEIYSALVRLVMKGGLAGVTIATLAKEANIGTGTMYVYFKGKEEVINQLYRKIKRETTERLMPAVRQQDTFMSSFRALVRLYLQSRMEHQAEAFFHDQCKRSHFLDEESKRLEKEAYQPFIEMIEEGKKQLLVKDLPGRVMIAFIQGAVSELAEHLKNNESISFDWAADLAFAMAWDSVKR